jgi:hypothetical protein
MLNVAVRLVSLTCFVLLLVQGQQAKAAAEYSSWYGTNIDEIQYQWRSQTYGAGIPSDCPMRFQYLGSAEKVSVQVVVNYAASGGHARPSDGKFRIEITRGTPAGGYATLNCNYISSVEISNVKMNSGGVQKFNRPTITDVELDQGSIKLLKAESEKLKLAGATKSLTAWSPLILLAGENQPLHIVLSLYETSWEEIGDSFPKVDKLTFVSLAQDARYYANRPELSSRPKLQKFWTAMADFYYSQAQQR